MSEKSLFAVLLRSPWWVSLLIAVVMALALAALLPRDYKLVGALSTFPFVVIAAMAARRQWQLPSAARVSEVGQALGDMPWAQFETLLKQAFARDGHEVLPATRAGADFVLERAGRRMLVSARRWKAARTGVEVLQALQQAREADEAPDALFIGLGELTDNARPFAAQHRIAVWQAAELALALRGMALPAPAVR